MWEGLKKKQKGKFEASKVNKDKSPFRSRVLDLSGSSFIFGPKNEIGGEGNT